MRHINVRCGVAASCALALAAGLAAQASGQGRPAGQEKKAGGGPVDRVVAEVVRLHNKEREKEGLGALKIDPKLMESSRRHAEDMAKHDKMSHEGSDGSTPEQRIERAGYRGRGTGENVAYGAKLPEKVMKLWMESPPHRANILGKYSEVGIGVERSAKGQTYWCVNFGEPWSEVDPATAAAAIRDGLNAARVEAGKAPLKLDPKLNAAAQAHARAAADRDAGGEKKAEGPTVTQRVDKAGYRYQSLGECASFGQADAKELVRILLGSPPNKKTIIGDFADLGVGVARSPDGIPHWSILLAQPLKPGSPAKGAKK